jgi:hypothetical protein
MPTQSKLPFRKSQFAILLVFLAAFVAFSALYRGSSQGDTSDTYPKGFRGGACTIETEALTIGYSGYYLPEDYIAPDNTIRSPHIPVQCGKIPKPGIVNISIDLLYPESARDIPLALRLVKIEIHDEQQLEHEMLSIPAQQYQSGVITQAFILSETGQYILYLDNKNHETPDFQIEVPIKVGSDWKDHFRNTFSTFLKKN